MHTVKKRKMHTVKKRKIHVIGKIKKSNRAIIKNSFYNII